MCKISVLQSCFWWSKKGGSKKNCALSFGGVQGLLDCCCMMFARCFRRVFKKPYKNRFFLSTLLKDAEETEKQEEKRPKKGNTQFGGP